jgi:hypothetical protein
MISWAAGGAPAELSRGSTSSTTSAAGSVQRMNGSATYRTDGTAKGPWLKTWSTLVPPL